MSTAQRGRIDFMGQRLRVFCLSLFFMVASLASLIIQGLNFGLDFTGGVSLQLSVPAVGSQASRLESIRRELDLAEYRQASVVSFGTDTDVLVRLADNTDPLLGESLLKLLQTRVDPGITLLGMEYVGPSVGEELRETGGLAVLLALAMVALYITFRFQSKFAVGAVLSLVHDVIIVLGCFSLFRWEFNLTVMAAFLAVIGYSINDTIVVFDRIREMFRKERKLDATQVINTAITDTLGRTLATSFTTLLVLFALGLFGGEQLLGFSIALIIGIGVGTYSSIYIASSILLTLGVDRLDLVPTKEEQPEMESLSS